jgi:hypothetical protein
MMHKTISACVAAIVAAGIMAAQPCVPDASGDRIARLIGQLGSPRFLEREAATRSLDAIGESALEALRSASACDDAEVRQRANDLRSRIEQRVAVARLLKPSTITLDFQRTPLDQAVKTLARTTNLTIELPNPTRYSGRTVTLQSSGLSVWQSIELFCRKADLHEWDGATPLAQGMRSATAVAVPPANIAIAGVQGRVVMAGGGVGQPSMPPNGRVILLDGPGPALSSHHSGAIRLRALPVGSPFAIKTVGDEVIFPLQVSVESRLRWSGAMHVRIDKAIDDLGESHDATGVVAAPVNSPNEVAWVALPNGAMMSQPSPGRSGPAALRIARGDRNAKRLSEVSGEIQGQAYVTEPLATIRGPLKSGDTTNSESGTTLKVANVSAPVGGEVKLTVEIGLPPEVQPIGPLAGNLNNRVVFQGGMVVQQMVIAGGKPASQPLPAGTMEYSGLSLEDVQGRRWPAISGYQESMRFGPEGQTSTVVVSFKEPAADAAPSRLVFHGSRPTVISMPFTFRDLNLP